MRVLCKASNVGNDVRCEVCGQGFLVYWTPKFDRDHDARVHEIKETLRGHHVAGDGPWAHPPVAFHLPEWSNDRELALAM